MSIFKLTQIVGFSNQNDQSTPIVSNKGKSDQSKAEKSLESAIEGLNTNPKQAEHLSGYSGNKNKKKGKKPKKQSKSKESKKKPAHERDIEVDAEFVGETNKPTQFVLLGMKEVDESGKAKSDVMQYEHPSFGAGLHQTFRQPIAIADFLGMTAHKEEQPKHEEHGYPLRPYQVERYIVNIGLFFTPADIVALYADRDDSAIRDYLFTSADDQGFTQKRRVMPKSQVDESSGEFEGNLPVYSGYYLDGDKGYLPLYLDVTDVSAMFGKTSLAATAETLEVEAGKELVSEDEKKDFGNTYIKDPERCLEYNRGDLICFKLYNEYARLIRDVGEKHDAEIEKVKLTMGANVANFTQEKILAMVKHADDQVMNKVKDKLWDEGDPKKPDFGGGEREILQELNREANPGSLAKSGSTTDMLGSWVDGGRCKNERPTTPNYHGVVADIDISGCYGNGLLNQEYPLGRPTSLSYHKKDKNRLNLGEVLNKYESELVPGLWFMRVNTTQKLSFNQDLITSKIASEKYEQEFEPGDITEIPGEFTLLSREIKNGLLNHDVLQACRACMSDREWKEFKQKCRVDLMLFYPKSLEVDSYREVLESVAEEGEIKHELKKDLTKVITDNRSHKWCKLPIGEGWMDALIKDRHDYQKGTPDNTIRKLIINAHYGVFASQFFTVSNSVVGNNITARARTLAWYMAKALGCFQTITDGGSFPLNEVNTWNKNKPSMNALFYINERHKLPYGNKKRLGTKPLNGRNWTVEDLKQNEKERIDEIDTAAWKHLQEFFPGDIDILYKKGRIISKKGEYTTEGQFIFETKGVFKGFTGHSQANYGLLKLDGEWEFKARGYQSNKNLFLDEDQQSEFLEGKPIELMLKDIFYNPDKVGHQPPTWCSNVLKIKAYEGKESKYLLPGDSVSKSTHPRAISPTQFRYQTWNQFTRWRKLSQRLKDETGLSLEWFNANNGASNVTKSLEEIQARIDQGKNPPEL